MKKILTFCLIMIIPSKNFAAEQDESIPMVTIINKHRFFTLRHRLHSLSRTIEDLCHIKISPDTGEVTLPEIESSGSLRIDILRQAFLEDRWATLLAIHETLKRYEQTDQLIISIELLCEITRTPTEYKEILREEISLKRQD